jgi:hypothetical protein
MHNYQIININLAIFFWNYILLLVTDIVIKDNTSCLITNKDSYMQSLSDMQLKKKGIALYVSKINSSEEQ